MSNSLTRSLYHLMRGASRSTSLSRLKQSGHKRVSILRYRDIEELIDTSVEKTLHKMGIELSDSDIKGLGAEARVEFLALLHERDSLRETVDDLVTQQEELEENRAALRRRMSETRTALDEEQEADEELVEFDEDLTSLQGRIAASLRVLLSDPATPRDQLTARAIELVRAAFEEQREEVAQRTRSEQAERVGLLQRRLSKLNKKLEESEAMLARARAAAGAASDEEIEEFDMEPAGLKAQDPQFEKKKQVLEEIFKLNVELKTMMTDADDENA